MRGAKSPGSLDTASGVVASYGPEQDKADEADLACIDSEKTEAGSSYLRVLQMMRQQKLSARCVWLQNHAHMGP